MENYPSSAGSRLARAKDPTFLNDINALGGIGVGSMFGAFSHSTGHSATSPTEFRPEARAGAVIASRIWPSAALLWVRMASDSGQIARFHFPGYLPDFCR